MLQNGMRTLIFPLANKCMHRTCNTSITWVLRTNNLIRHDIMQLHLLRCSYAPINYLCIIYTKCKENTRRTQHIKQYASPRNKYSKIHWLLSFDTGKRCLDKKGMPDRNITILITKLLRWWYLLMLYRTWVRACKSCNNYESPLNGQ